MHFVYKTLLPLLLAGLVLAGCDSGSTVPDDLGTNTTIAFAEESATVTEGDTYTLAISITDPGFKTLNAQLSLDAASSTIAADDVQLETTTITFPEDITSGETVAVDVTIADDELIAEGTQVAVLTLSGEGDVATDEPSRFELQVEESRPAMPIDAARAEEFGTTVRVKGTVTRAFGDFVRLQDASGPTGASGIVVRQGGDSEQQQAFRDAIADGTIQPGTVLALEGQLGAFAGLTQMDGDDLAIYQIVEQGDPSAPQAITLDDLQDNVGEEYESELVRIEGLTFPFENGGNFSSGTDYTVEDENGTQLVLRVQGSSESDVAGSPIPTGTFTFEGVVGQFHGFDFDTRDPDTGYQLIPVRPSDIVTGN